MFLHSFLYWSHTDLIFDLLIFSSFSPSELFGLCFLQLSPDTHPVRSVSVVLATLTERQHNKLLFFFFRIIPRVIRLLTSSRSIGAVLLLYFFIVDNYRV